ncbi:unnamed protein product [Spirodela intermedia]|uniref:Uncharacterized protein n=1 Tax=Spirodela intermedia TaxID=51605 RepID=A0A7I8LH07_SPIIN|nr:unnamed protein product [Spirodela intermedia]
MSHRIVSSGCHPAEWKNSDFAALRRLKTATLRLSGGCHPTERGWMEVRRWRLVSRRIVLFPTTACSSINRR